MTISYASLFLAALAAFVAGWIWYGPLFSKAWIASLGKTHEQLKAGARPLPLLLALSFAGALLMAWVLAGLMLHLAKGGVPATLKNGVLTGAFCWLGFVAATMPVNHGYSGAKWSQTLIDLGYWLVVLVLEGAIVGAWGIR